MKSVRRIVLEWSKLKVGCVHFTHKYITCNALVIIDGEVIRVNRRGDCAYSDPAVVVILFYAIFVVSIIIPRQLLVEHLLK